MIVHITQSVVDVWNKFKQYRANSTEACGILIGHYDMDCTRIWINNVTVPMKADIRKKTYFFLKDNGHQKILNSIFKSSGNKLLLLGTWHTHPEKSPTPSMYGEVNDVAEWKKIIASNKAIPDFCFAIVGTQENSIYIRYQNKFERLNRIVKV